MNTLPSRANLDHVKKQAKELLRLYRDGDATAISRFIDNLPAATHRTDQRQNGIDTGCHSRRGPDGTVIGEEAVFDNDLGPDAAKMVARLLVMNQRRLGGQMQHSALLDMTPKSDRIELVLAHIRRNLRNPLTVEELAAVANLSPRQFSRAFVAETGQSPAKAVEQLRLEAARFMIEQGRHTINVVAQETGFADRERMRRAFVRTFGVPADMLRRNARREPVAGN